MATKIGILGSGIVAQTLGAGFLKKGYEVMLGTRTVSKLDEWISGEGAGATAGSFEEAASFGEILVLAVSGEAASEVLSLAEEENFMEKTIIDATNPISHKIPPVNGVLSFFTNGESLMEQLQAAFPSAYFVKAFNSVGNPFMVDPKFESKPTMFICGNEEKAKAQVRKILDEFGWEVADMGEVEAARAIEPLCILWCIPGMRENKWNHAFKLLTQ